MKRQVTGALLATGIALAISAATGMPAAAQGGATSPNASCVGLLSDAEAHLFPHGFIGQEVSGAATSAPGVVGEFGKTVAKNHAGTIEGCIVG
jgi:hypothetical protein